MLHPLMLTMQDSAKCKAARELVMWVNDLVTQLGKAQAPVDASSLVVQLIGIRDGISDLVKEHEV